MVSPGYAILIMQISWDILDRRKIVRKVVVEINFYLGQNCMKIQLTALTLGQDMILNLAIGWIKRTVWSTTSESNDLKIWSTVKMYDQDSLSLQLLILKSSPFSCNKMTSCTLAHFPHRKCSKTY